MIWILKLRLDRITGLTKFVFLEREMYRLLLAVVIVMTFASAFPVLALSQELAGVKCVVEGDRNAQEQFKAAHAEGEVYFCCKKCASAFAADHSSYQTRANHQLVVTQQYVQVACPIAGEDFVAQQSAKIGGVEVAFCCENCKTKVDTADNLPAKAELVFGPAAFKRAFAKSKSDSESATPSIDFSDVKCLLQAKRSVQEKFAADYRAGKVYFCCSNCLKAFQADPVKFSAQANMQLVSTKQYQQTACPLTDGDADGSKIVSVGGQDVAFCCGVCQEKVQAVDEQERVAMVFDDAVFEKSFSKVGKDEAAEYFLAPEALAAPGK